jgi:CubicO group peptidase (beta-lactamase class C family)
MFGRRARALAMAFLVAGGTPGLALADSPPPSLDRADLESFLDGFIEGRMKAFDVVGVTVSVVHGGELILAKGYGHDDLEAGRPVDAARSLFRPGSISKTLTWTAVMQLHEQGKLDLETDIQTYLPEIPIPRTFDEPITMLHLMAHAPGFEDSAAGHLFAGSADEVLPLVEYLQTHQPARVRLPGTIPAYSNYGTGLAGQIVSHLSGMPFEDYVERNILEPLGMEHTTFREPWGPQRPDPMPDALRANVSKGYLRKVGRFEASDFEFIGQIGPAGALSTTATDMARWMLVHLGEGSYAGARILRPDTARLMHTRHFALDPELPGVAHGFIEGRIHGYRALGHGGGTVHFISDLQIIPDLGFGLFVSTNTTGGGGRLIRDLVRLVVERYFPPGTELSTPKPPADFADRAGRFTGTFLLSRRAFTTVEKLLNPATVSIQATEDGHLLVQTPLGESRLVEVGPLTFQDTERHELLKFVEDESGAVTGAHLSIPIMVLQRARLTDTPGFRLGVMGLAALVFVCALVAAWLRRKRALEQSTGERAASLVTLATGALWVLALVVSVVSLLPIAQDFRAVFYGFPPPLFVAGLTVGLVAAIGTFASAILLYPVWSGGSWSLGRRVRHTTVVLLAGVLLWVLYDGNAIGYRYF